MKGSDKYCGLFTKNEQHGRLYLVPGRHARGNTFCIYVIPDGEQAISNGMGNAPLNDGSVEVYGVVSGQRGWTEEYGWIHKGKWCDDFQKICEAREAKIQASNAERSEWVKAKKSAEAAKATMLLNTYQ